MLSRIFWISVAGIALIAGMAMQDGGRIFSWADDHAHISEKTEQAIADRVDRVVKENVEEMAVMGADGDEIDVPPETKRALGEAIGRLVKAETSLAMLKISDGSAEERKAAEARRVQARAEVERLKAEIKRHDPSALVDAGTVSEQVRSQVREDIRAEVREAVEN